MKEKIALVWLKRDLRISDHEPLARAIELGLPIYAFYLLEPNLLRCPDVDIRHLRFIWESIRDMKSGSLGWKLPQSIRIGRKQERNGYLLTNHWYSRVFWILDIKNIPVVYLSRKRVEPIVRA